MPVTEHYDLVNKLRRMSRAFVPGGSHETALLAAAGEIEALRAALAAQPQPLFEGRVIDATVSAKFTIQADSSGVTYPGPNDRVVVYPAVAGSATPTLTIEQREDLAYEAGLVAGSATPTGDDDA